MQHSKCSERGVSTEGSVGWGQGVEEARKTHRGHGRVSRMSGGIWVSGGQGQTSLGKDVRVCWVQTLQIIQYGWNLVGP